MKHISKRAISWISVVAMLVTMVAACGLTIPMMASAETVLFSENFDSYANGTLPDGWTLNNDYASGTASVQDGAMVINGRGSDSQTRLFYLGSELANHGDYTVEADYTILESDYALSVSSRWSGFAFRVSEGVHPYFYVTTRVRTGTTANELSWRTETGFGKIDEAAAPADQALNTTYRMKVICSGVKVKFYIDDALVFDSVLSTASTYTYLDKGSIGFITSNLKIKIDNIVVTETIPTVETQPTFYDTYIPTTDIINPPSVVLDVTDSSVYENKLMDSVEKTAATSLYYLNSDLNITTADGSAVITSFASALSKTDGKIIPALYIKDTATADALATFTSEVALQDAFIVADDAALLKYARTKMPKLYGVLYTKLTTAATEKDLAAMVANTNEALGKTVMVDANYVSKEDVAYMQQRLMNVWVTGVGADGYAVYDNVAKGVNGIVTTDDGQAIWILEDRITSPDGTPIMIREPYMYAHRGYSALAPQNTMEAFYEAVNYGADLIEMDVRLTSDGVVVLWHDTYLIGDYYLNGWSSTPLTDCTDRTKTVENSTYAEIQQLTVTENGKSGKIPTLEQFLELIDQTDNVVGIVEIKNYSYPLIDATAKIIKEMGMEDKVVSICFGREYCDYVRKLLPGVSVGWLANAVDTYTTPEAIIGYAKNYIMSGNLSYHPNYGQIWVSGSNTKLKDNVIEFAAQRGISYNPWTLNAGSVFDTAYINGIQGITTDHLEFDDGYVRKLTPGLTYNMQQGVAAKVQALGFTSFGNELYNCEVLEIGGADAEAVGFTNNSDGTVTASGTGTVNAMLMYKASTQYMGNYYVISQPAQIKVSDAAVTNATSDYHTSLLPAYVAKWTNSMSNQTAGVSREDRGEVFTTVSGSWPAVTASIDVSTTRDASITYEISGDSCASIILILSDGTSYELQKYMGDSVTLNGADLQLNGSTVSGTIKLSDVLPSSYSDVTISSVRVFNVAGVGGETVIKKLDLVEQIPSTVSLMGDVNASGTVDTADARAIINSTLGKESLTYKQARAADINGDSSINSTDARMLMRMLVS